MPLIHEFEYKKGGIAPPSQTKDFIMQNYSNPLRWNGDPPWANVAANQDTKKIIISVNKEYVDHIPAGEYQAFPQLYERTGVIYDSGDPEESWQIVAGFIIRLKVTERVPTTISPASFDFYYKIGNAAFPEDQFLNINSEDSYTINKNQTWLKTSTTSGSGNSRVGVGVNIQGLLPGTYTGVVSVADSVGSFAASISLVIDGELGTEDYLFVTPDQISFEHTRYGFLPSFKNISVNASDNFSITPASPWIDVSRSAGNQNTLSFDIGLNSNVNSLGIGVFVSEVNITLGDITKKVIVTVDISQFIEDLFDPEKLYFTDDDNIIQLVSSTENTQLSVLIKASHKDVLHRFKYSIPFFKGLSKTYIGGEIRKIIKKLPDDILKGGITPKVYHPYKVASVDFDITENKIYSEDVLRGVPLQKIRFIKGVAPDNSKLTQLPDKIYVTKKGVVSFSFLEQNESAPNDIVVSGDKVASIPFQVDRNEFYSVVFPVQELGVLQTGDEFTISSSGVSLRVQIKPEGIDHCLLIWENMWGCWDFFECTGKISVKSSYRYTQEEYRKDRNTLVKEVLDIQQEGSFTVDTGWIYNKEEVKYLETLFKSNNVMVVLDGKIIKVNNKTSSFISYETRNFKESFTLTFEKTER